MILGAALGISAACLIAYCLGRWHGLAAAFESLRPTLSSYGEAPGDQFPVFHSASVTEERQRHHGC